MVSLHCEDNIIHLLHHLCSAIFLQTLVIS